MPIGVYKRTEKHLEQLAKARAKIKRGPLSEETTRKIGDAKRKQVEFYCEYCGKLSSDRPSHFRRKKRHFCSMECYSKYREEIMSPNEQPTWRGGVSQTESHRRWKKKNPERMAHLKARRYARERGAEGGHTLEEWEQLKKKHGFKCAVCGLKKPLTKDHIIPLSENGTDNIENIQPLCRNCNSKKWKKLEAQCKGQKSNKPKK